MSNERAAFEDWHTRWMGYPKVGLKPSSFSNRVYDSDDTEHLWRGWEAARSKRVPANEKRVTKLMLSAMRNVRGNWVSGGDMEKAQAEEILRVLTANSVELVWTKGSGV